MKELQCMDNMKVQVDHTGDILQALLMISDSGLACETALENAECMVQDLTDGYFGKDMVDTAEARLALFYQCKEYQIRARISFDYVREASTHLSTVTWAIQKALDEVRQRVRA